MDEFQDGIDSAQGFGLFLLGALIGYALLPFVAVRRAYLWARALETLK